MNLLLLTGDQRTLIFVSTRADAASLAEKLAGDGFAALPLSGDLAQAQRTRTLNAFRNGTVSVLVATDVAARGLDVPDVPLIIHGGMPMDGEVYTHRSGRTGRAGQKGRSILLAIPNAERRARRIFADAKVEAQWQLVPSAANVNKALKKRMRRAAWKTIDDAASKVSEAEVEYAQKLLEDRDAAQVVATLLAGMQTKMAREPFDLETPMPRSTAKTTRPARPGGSRPNDNEFTQFKINWGFRDGANPSRLLAAICRRGDVSSRVIGAIDIDSNATIFHVANDAAQQFEQRATRPDSRDRNQRIERVSGGARQGGSRSGRPTPIVRRPRMTLQERALRRSAETVSAAQG